MSTNYIAPIWRMPKNAHRDRVSNYSIEFNPATNNYIEITDNILTGLENFSISVWYNTNTITGDRAIFGSWNTAPAQMLLYWDNPGSGWRFLMTDGTSASVSGPSSIDLNQWNHIVVTYDGATLKFYHNNGTPTTTAVVRGPIQASTNSWNIGADNNGARLWNGEISQFCLFDYTLTPSQVEDLFNVDNPMNFSGKPIAYYPLGDDSNVVNSTPTNTETFFPNISVGADSVFDFDASNNEKITASNITSFNTGDLSASIWFYATNSGNNIEYLFDNSNALATAGFTIAINSSNGHAWYIGRATTTHQYLISNVNINFTNNVWNHLCFSYNDTTKDFVLYLNGNSVNSGTATSVTKSPSTNPITIGGQHTSYDFTGKLSNAQIWQAALTGPEALELYNNGQPLMTGTQPQEANLKGWWKLNQSANWEADTTGEWQVPDARSAYPQSFRFTESQDYITGDINLARDKVHAVSFWVKNKQVSGLGYVVTNRVSSYGPGFSFIINQSGSNNGYIFSNVATSPTTTQSVATNYISQLRIPNDDQWHHVAWTQDTVTYKLKAYIDGVFVYEQLPTVRTDSNNIADLKISSNVSTQDFGGFVSNIMVWEDVVLTDGNVALNDVALGEIAELYNGGIPITSASVQPNNLKGWCKLDGSEFYMNLGVGTGFANTWSIENQALPANYNSALYFSGGQGDEHLETPNVSALQLGGSHSFSFWINIDSTQTDSTGYFFNKGTLEYAVQLGGTTLRLIYYTYNGIGGNNANIPLDSSWKTTWEDGWHHVLISVDQPSLTITMYMDGGADVVTASLPADFIAPNQSTGNLNIMSYNGSSLSAAGFLSNLAFYNGTVLTLSDAETLYNNGTPEDNISFSPTSWWKIDNTSTGLLDNVGTSNLTNTGAIQKNIPVSTHNLTSINQTDDNLVNNNVSALNGESSGMDINNLVQSDLTRKVPFSNYSYNLDGATEYWDGSASLGDYIGDNYTDYLSVSLWFYPRDTAGDGGLFQLRPVGAGSTYLELSIYLWSNFLYLDAGAQDDDVAFGTANNNTWNHLLGVFHPTGVKLYLNGEETALTFTYSDLDLLNNEVWIGQYFSSSYPFDGNVMHCAVWDEQLFEADASKLYNNGVPQDLRDFRVTPLRWWALDENYSYWNGTRMIGRELMAGDDIQGINIDQIDLEGNAPANQASGIGNNLVVSDLKGNMKDSKYNAYSINMADYGDPGGNPPADSGRTVDVP